jgi:hypothetical protein
VDEPIGQQPPAANDLKMSRGVTIVAAAQIDADEGVEGALRHAVEGPIAVVSHVRNTAER